MKKGKLKVLVVFGTRPEAIKLAPVIRKLNENKNEFIPVVCVTAQHREMLDQVLNLFEINPDYDLDLMTENQTLPGLTTKILNAITNVLRKEKPDLICVQGDTTTTSIASLASYYLRIPVAHIEAGLRTSNKYSPFPEEINRRITSVIADFHFAPTRQAKKNLIKEGISESTIYVTGNTVIDALKWVMEKHKATEVDKKWLDFFSKRFDILVSNGPKTILVTGHRRESFGEGFKQICMALSSLAKRNYDIQIVYPVHLNPNVQKPVNSILGNISNIFLVPPLEYEPFVFLMNKCHIVLTDSGGIQEEAPSLGKPVLVMRNNTERPEGIEVGTARLVGTNTEKIIKETENLLYNAKEYEKIARAVNPYGDGHAAQKIVSSLKSCCVSKKIAAKDI